VDLRLCVLVLLLVRRIVADVMAIAGQESIETTVSHRSNPSIPSTHLSNDDKIFAGIGRKFRIDVGGKVVEVNTGRLVDRVCVEVVGCVFELTLACGDSPASEFVVALAAPVDGTGIEMFALMM
jgi:hypothetical protein